MELKVYDHATNGHHEVGCYGENNASSHFLRAQFKGGNLMLGKIAIFLGSSMP